MIKRDKYLNQLIKSKNNGFPKVITGIRRCGKSFLLKEIFKEHLVSSGVTSDRIIIIELDDNRNALYRDPIELSNYVTEKCKGKSECYVFLDEIQKVDTIVNPAYTEGKHILAKKTDLSVISFVDVVLGLSRETNIDLYVTGSNSKMLSSDIITEFRDKATEIKLAPLSFKEYFDFVGGNKTEALSEFMYHGGMPLAVLKNEEEKEIYLKELFQKTYYADILEHNNLFKSESLDELCVILSSCIGTLLNSEKIANTYVSKKKEKIDKETVTKYINFFIDAFIIKEVKRFDLKGRKYINSTRKYYFTDLGLRNAKLDFIYQDEGQLLENIVYNELIYNGYNVNAGTFDSFENDENGKTIRRSHEVDFLATKGIETFYIQVSSDINKIEIRNREIKPFKKLNDQIRKIIVINKPIKEMKDENGFSIIGITDFLLNLFK
ncbi:MAG TPA: ATPase [Acholeplasmatales bacterium]|nr:ATPase [Acholeplasmatales bacterium]